MAALATGDLGDFGPRERVALEFAEQLTRHSNHIPESQFAELRKHYEEAEIVEIAAVAGLFNYFNRFNNALDMEPTR